MVSVLSLVVRRIEPKLGGRIGAVRRRRAGFPQTAVWASLIWGCIG
jgi:hypothetical protein